MPLLSRRGFLLSTLAAPLLAHPARAQMSALAQAPRNLMGFRTQEWQPYFDTLARGAILCDLDARVLHHWRQGGESYRLYPTSVPLTEDFTRRGHTEITLMRRAPTWIPTPSMRAANPDLPARIGPGPENPMGTRAMNLGWPYYRIHGTDNPEKIGRRASSGCIGMFNHHVEELFDEVGVGTPVLVL
jgi:hypothetical protein